MSKNIIIQEGDIGKQMTVDKLKTDLAGGGSCLWVPEDGTTLGTKYINADGTYKASSDGLYGYSEVTVRGTGKATGKDSDGDDAYVYTDPTTGRLVTKKLPSSLVVTVNPSKMTYWDGETLDFTGMVVKAYLATGGLWTDSSHPNGVIPVSELAFPITTADYSKVHTSEYSDGQGLNAEFIVYDPTWDVDYYGHDTLHWQSQSIGMYKMTRQGETNWYFAYFGDSSGPTEYYITQVYSDDENKNILYIWGSTNSRKTDIWIENPEYADRKPGENVPRYLLTAASSSTSGTGEVVLGPGYSNLDADIPVSTKIPTGSETLQPVDAYQEIPVQWTRPNGDVLETSFRITVVPSN